MNKYIFVVIILISYYQSGLSQCGTIARKPIQSNTSNSYGACGITSSTPGPPLYFINTSVASNTYEQREVHIQGSTIFLADITFINCDIYLDDNFTYQYLNNGSIPTFTFRDCHIYLHGVFRSNLGFDDTPAQFVFEGCCISNRDAGTLFPEIMHLQSAGLKFVNNNVSISGLQPRMFHLKNMDLSLINEFHGNTFDYGIDAGFGGDGLIAVDQSAGTIIIGDNNQAKNIFNIRGAAIVDLAVNDNVQVENSEFNI